MVGPRGAASRRDGDALALLRHWSSQTVIGIRVVFLALSHAAKDTKKNPTDRIFALAAVPPMIYVN